MLLKRPTGAGSAAIANWDSTNRLTVEILNVYWEKISAALPMPGTMAGDGASYSEFKDKYGNKCFGTRRADGAKHGVIRSVDSSWIYEQTYFEDKKHGLSFGWYKNDICGAFVARIFEHGEQKACI